MRTPLKLAVPVTLALFACSEAPELGKSRLFDDAGVSHPDASIANGTGGLPNGTGGATSGTGGATSAGGARAPDAGLCVDSVWNGVQGGGSPLLEADAASNSPAPIPLEAGHLPGLPTDPCGVKPLPACPSGPHAIFSCPEISGWTAPRMVAPGDQITVRVPVSDEGNDGYACTGIAAEPPLEDASVLSYAVKPAYVQIIGRVPSLPSGSFIHFTTSVSGGRYPGSPACAGDLTQFEFDLEVFAPR